MSDPSLVRRYSFPLTPYDVVGYLLPGGTLLLCVFLFESWSYHVPETESLHNPVYNALSLSTNRLFEGETDWLISFILLAVTVVYPGPLGSSNWGFV